MYDALADGRVAYGRGTERKRDTTPLITAIERVVTRARAAA